jgi:hypothetical protein
MWTDCAGVLAREPKPRLCHVHHRENVRNSGLSRVGARWRSGRSKGKLALRRTTPKTSRRFSAGSGFESLMAHKTPVLLGLLGYILVVLG